MMSRLVFWNVDTQHDFMDRDGALYVPGAEAIKPALAALTAYARRRGIRVVGSVDRHSPGDPEMQANGGPFPIHCLAGTLGQRMIPETEPADPRFVANREYDRQELQRVLSHPGEILFEKQHYDVFTNPNTTPVIRELGVREAVVYGVATDYCNRAAAVGLRRADIAVCIVRDAVKPVTEAGGQSALAEMTALGVRTVTLAEVLAGSLEADSPHRQAERQVP